MLDGQVPGKIVSLVRIRNLAAVGYRAQKSIDEPYFRFVPAGSPCQAHRGVAGSVSRNRIKKQHLVHSQAQHVFKRWPDTPSAFAVLPDYPIQGVTVFQNTVHQIGKKTRLPGSNPGRIESLTNQNGGERSLFLHPIEYVQCRFANIHSRPIARLVRALHPGPGPPSRYTLSRSLPPSCGLCLPTVPPEASEHRLRTLLEGLWEHLLIPLHPVPHRQAWW